jgi:hypothetical protein
MGKRRTGCNFCGCCSGILLNYNGVKLTDYNFFQLLKSIPDARTQISLLETIYLSLFLDTSQLKPEAQAILSSARIASGKNQQQTLPKEEQDLLKLIDSSENLGEVSGKDYIGTATITKALLDLISDILQEVKVIFVLIVGNIIVITIHD